MEGYICIYGKQDNKDVCYFCYTDDWQKKLDEINSGLFDGLFYECYAHYEPASEAEVEKIFTVINSLGSNLMMKGNQNIFKISPEGMYDVLYNIVSLEHGSRRLKRESKTNKSHPKSARSDIKVKKPHKPRSNGISRQTNSSEGIEKEEAIKLFEEIGFKFDWSNATFASRNKTHNYYWGNPNKDVLQQDWILILNDYDNKLIHLFFIPAHSISEDDIPIRTDSSHLNDLRIEIRYNDETFSNIPVKNKPLKFDKYLLATRTYGESEIKTGKNWTDLDAVLSQETKDVYTLEDNFDLIYGQPTEFSYEGNHYKVKSYRDLIRKTLVVFSSKDKEKIYELGRSKYRPTEKCKKPYITCDKNDIKLGREIPEFPGLYFNLTLNGNDALIFIKGLAKEFGIDPTTYSYKVIIVPQEHK